MSRNFSISFPPVLSGPHYVVKKDQNCSCGDQAVDDEDVRYCFPVNPRQVPLGENVAFRNSPPNGESCDNSAQCLRSGWFPCEGTRESLISSGTTPLRRVYFSQQGTVAEYDARFFASSPEWLQRWNESNGNGSVSSQQAMKNAIDAAVVPNSLETNSSLCPFYKSFEKKGREDGCSLLMSTGQRGKKFQEQVTATQESLKKYCENSNTPDCACIAPNNKVFDAISSKTDIDASCWWKPCSSPRFLNGSTQQKCPSNTCQEIRNIVENSNIDRREAQRWISCTIPQNEQQVQDNNASSSAMTQTTTPNSGFSLTTLVLVGGGVLLVVFIIGLVVYLNR